MTKLPTWFKSPDAWALTISAIALLVSTGTWLQVDQQLRLTAGQVKAYVQVVDATLVEPVSTASFITLRLRIKNCGQTAASDVHGEMDYDLGMPDPNGDGNGATRRDFGPMGPGIERDVRLTSNRINRRDWPTPSHVSPSIYFFGTVWYTDETTGDKRKEDWCFVLPLRAESDLNRTDLERSGVLMYRSKD